VPPRKIKKEKKEILFAGVPSFEIGKERSYYHPRGAPTKKNIFRSIGEPRGNGAIKGP
jgi:hypothetical protein